MIKAENIRDMNHVKGILDYIKAYIIAYEEQIGEVSEDVLENINFQLCEIEEFVIGAQKCDDVNLANADIRMMTYWKYIDGKCSFGNMIGELKKYEGEI